MKGSRINASGDCKHKRCHLPVGHSFDYPQALSFARWHLPPHARIHSTIGEWPDAAILGHLAITATDRGSGG